MYTAKEAEDKILSWLNDFGYSEDDRNKIQQAVNSGEIQTRLASQKEIVENRIKTIKIPTIMFDGRRYDRAVGPEKLVK